MSLYNELKRRNVLRVAAAYLVMAWLLIQVIETIFPLFGFGDTPARIAVLALAILFFPAMVFSWVFEITPEGLKKDKDIDRSEPSIQDAGKKLDRAIMIVLALALTYFAVDKFVLSESREATIAETARLEGRNEAIVEVYGDNSIAVMPFVNMSSDQEQEYFSDGLSEELLNLLAKIPQLRVTSRSSSFAFKGEKIDIPEVARQLNVAHILEGSVRKAGNQVRVTAQLIEAATDTHIWSQTFDRPLDNIFAIQDEIASEVVTQLKITLLSEAETAHKTDTEAYALYLQGRHLRRLSTVESFEQAEALLQQALAIDPEYAPSWDELGYLYINQVNLSLRPVDEGITLARESIIQALAIDPEYALAHASLGFIASAYDNRPVAAARHLERALKLAPADTGIIGSAAALTASLGRLDEAITLSEFVVDRDPVSPTSHINLGELYTSAGRWDDAIASFNTALTLNPGSSAIHFSIGTALLLKGEAQAALEAMQAEDSIWGQIGLAMAWHSLGQLEKSDAVLAELIEQNEQGLAYNIAYVMAWRGEPDQAFEWLDKAVEYKDAGLSVILNENLFASIHDDSRWLPFLERIGKSPQQLAAIEFEVELKE